MDNARALSPDSLGLMRTAIGAVVLLAGAAVTGQMARGRPLPLGPLLVFGIAGAVFQLCLFRAFRDIGVTITVAVTVCLPPLIVAVADAVTARRAPCALVLLALALAAGGVCAIVLPSGGAAPVRAVSAEGWGLLLAASLAFSAVAMSARRAAQVLHPLFGTGLGLAVCAGVLPLFSVAAGTFSLAPVAGLGRSDLLILLYLGLVATGGAYLAFSVGLRLCRSSGSGLVASMIEPMLAALLAAHLLKEHLRPAELAGCTAVVLAMVLVWRAENRPA